MGSALESGSGCVSGHCVSASFSMLMKARSNRFILRFPTTCWVGQMLWAESVTTKSSVIKHDTMAPANRLERPVHFSTCPRPALKRCGLISNTMIRYGEVQSSESTRVS